MVGILIKVKADLRKLKVRESSMTLEKQLMLDRTDDYAWPIIKKELQNLTRE